MTRSRTLGRRLPEAWADFSWGLTRQQIENVLQFSGVTVIFDGEPVAVLLSAEEFRSCHCPDHMREHS